MPSTGGANEVSDDRYRANDGDVAQLGERVLCKHEVASSTLVISTSKLKENFLIYNFSDFIKIGNSFFDNP